MADLIVCPTCSAKVSERAKQCPHCGEPDPYNGSMDRKLRGLTRTMTVYRVTFEGILLGRIEPEGLTGETTLRGLDRSGAEQRYPEGSKVRVKIEYVHLDGQYAKVNLA